MEQKTKETPSIWGEDEIGVGTWAWGDTFYWGFGQDYDKDDLEAVFDYSISLGIDLFDTAEIFGQGQSEMFLGKFLAKTNRPVRIMTKFMPYPWRLWRSALKKALKGSLTRLGVQKIDIYQIHKPLPPVSIETWMEGLLEVYQAGLCKAVGVCNFNRDQMLRAFDYLAREGIHLSCNQMEFNLINREAEKNGLINRCLERGIKPVAYSPLCSGLLSGKYNELYPPKGIRGQTFNQNYLKNLKPLISTLRDIGMTHGNRSPGQVALNWIICKGVLPVPGAKNLEQVEQNAGAAGWRLTDEEIVRLDLTSDQFNQHRM